MKFTIPMAVTFDAYSPQQAAAFRDELEKLTRETDVKIAIAGAAAGSGATNAKTLVGPPQLIGR